MFIYYKYIYVLQYLKSNFFPGESKKKHLRSFDKVELIYDHEYINPMERRLALQRGLMDAHPDSYADTALRNAAPSRVTHLGIKKTLVFKYLIYPALRN